MRQAWTIHLLAHILFTTQANALFRTGISPAIQDPVTNPPLKICPVAQDGATSNTFPWTINPTCLQTVIPDEKQDHGHIGTHETFCVYTNTEFHAKRGISLITTPEVAAELTYTTFEPYESLSADPAPFAQKHIEGKGEGLFATRDISEGDALMLNSPVLFVHRHALETPSRQRRHTLLRTAIDQLPKKTKDSFMALSRQGGEYEIEDIINVNSMRVKVWDGSSHLVVVPEASRVNHACRPNAHYRFDDTTLNLDVSALTDIKSGEELTFSYGYSHLPHEPRIQALQETWGFTCTCPLCTANSTTKSASDARLQQISEIKSILPTSPSSMPELLGLLPDLISLLEAENLIKDLPMYEEILAYTWSSFGIEERAKIWAGRAARHWSIVAGRESWEAKRMRDMEEDVRGHGTWLGWDGEDPWEGVGKGHPWEMDDHDHDHDD
ncbi:SET domain-containing protein [Periconia macrospinosa]|uniref:SET domain-containing protein n=1 Tax=Periconia macrospinosa TaxID=97972 RepID=A0A2V1E1D6_9PLEO|nr:SET domain-containing protein [Periconia macrospinosa]